MGKYRAKDLEEHKYAILGLFIEKVREFRTTGKYPIGLEGYSGILREALPFFSEHEQSRLKDTLKHVADQIKYISAKQTIKILKKDASDRVAQIDAFLKNPTEDEIDLEKAISEFRAKQN